MTNRDALHEARILLNTMRYHIEETGCYYLGEENFKILEAAMFPREMRLIIEGMAQQELSEEMNEELLERADFQVGYDEMVKHARKLKAMMFSEEK